MEMDKLTRRQADRIEFVMRDLLRDLQLISFLPLDLYPWTRRSCLESARNHLADMKANKGGIGEISSLGDDDLSTYAAQLIYGVAGRYGDATDVDNNELLLQMAELAEVEKELLETATSAGTVDEYDVNHHHKLFRAVLDTLQQEGYAEFVVHSLQAGSGGDPIDTGRGEVYPMDPAVFSRLVDPGISSLQRAVECLCELLVVRNASTVSEDIHNYKILHEAVNKEKSSSADVKALKREYHETKEARRTEVAALQAEVRQLEDEIQYTRSVLELELSAFDDANARIEEERQVEDAERINSLKEEAEALKRKLEVAIAANQEEAAALRTQRAKKEAAVSAAISEYDTQMANLHAASAALNKETEEDTEAIVALDGELNVLRTERSEYELEKHIEEMRERHYERMNEQARRCASTIQACFRAYLTRVSFERGLANMKRRKKRKS